jgi:hypothetical protein
MKIVFRSNLLAFSPRWKTEAYLGRTPGGF